jgi:mono/diheme cytochrome c family protein
MSRNVVVILPVVIAAAAAAAGARAQEVGQRTSPVVFNAYDGREQFATYCASCHGTSGRGNGPMGQSLKRPPADLTSFATRHDGRFDPELVYQIIDGRKWVKDHGSADMPVWGDTFSKAVDGSSPGAIKDRIDAIVRWLQTIQRKPE